MQDEIRVTVIATGFEESPVASSASPSDNPVSSASSVIKPVQPKERSSTLFTGAAEKAPFNATSSSTIAPPPLNVAPAIERQTAPKNEDAQGEDPFDSIFKIFNANGK